MKILFFGRGVIAAQYGWALEQAGHTVEFYVRPGRTAQYGPTLPLNLLDARRQPRGVRITERWPVQLREDLPATHDYDLLILSVPHYQVREAAAFLAPRLGQATLLVFSNFWQEPLTQVAPLPLDQLAWGFPQAGGRFTAAGVLEGALLNKVHVGTFGTAPTAREVAVRDLLRQSGFQLVEHADFRGWLWLHFAVITGFFAPALASGTVARVMASGQNGRAAVRLIQELLPVVAARGVNLKNNAAETALFRLPPWLASLVMRGLLRLSPPFRAAFASPIAPLEAQACCRDVLLEAQRLRVPVPQLEAARSLYE